MAKTERYQPCDQEGRIGKPVGGSEDFKDFCVFMSDQSESAKALRKKAYDRISETGEATPKAKIDFVRANALDYFKSQLKSGNTLSAQSLSNDASSWDEGFAESFITAMGREFKGLVSAVGADIFDGMLLASSLTEQARQALVKALWAGDEFASEVIQLALKAERGQAAKALARWRETPEARVKMSSALKVEMVEDRMSLDAKYGVYAPLLKFLTEQMGVAQRAEYFARFEDYANSGFFDEDLALADGAQRDGLRATPSAHAWKRLASMVMSGQEPQPAAQEVRAALHMRLAEVGMKIDVPSIKDGKSTTWKGVPSKLKAADIDNLAARGQIDGFTLCSDKTALVSFVTTNELLKTQEAQWARHFIAVEKALPELGITGASYRILAPCMIADAGVGTSSKPAGSALAAWFSGERKIDPQTQGMINAIPFMLELMKGSKTILSTADLGGVGSWAAQMNFELIGSSRNAWPMVQAAIAASNEPDLEFDRQMLTMAGRVLDGLAAGAAIRGVGAAKICGVGTMDRSGSKVEVMLDFVEQAVRNCRLSSDPELLGIAKAVNSKLSKAKPAFGEGSDVEALIASVGDSVEVLIKLLSKNKKLIASAPVAASGKASKSKAGAKSAQTPHASKNGIAHRVQKNKPA